MAAIKEDYEAIQLEQEKVKEELDRKEAQLAVQVEAAYTMIANLDQLAEDAQAEYAAIAAAEEETAAQLDELSRQLAAQEAAAWWAAQQAAQGSGTAGGGSGTVTGGEHWDHRRREQRDARLLQREPDLAHGQYIHHLQFRQPGRPHSGASTNHQGLDIGAAAGTPSTRRPAAPLR